MLSNSLLVWIGVASAAAVVALMMWKPRRGFATRQAMEAGKASRHWRDVTFASMILSFAATIGLARAQAEQSGDGNADSGHSWPGSHLDHSTGGFSDSGGFSHGGGGFSGGDSGGFSGGGGDAGGAF